MKPRVRFFNFGSPDEAFAMHSKEWYPEVPGDASGRELVQIAMRLSGWPDGPYKAEFEKRGSSIEVAVSVEERPQQLITIWINDPPARLESKSFEFIQPIGSRIIAAAWNRLVAIGIYLVCMAGVSVVAFGQLYWAFREPERTRGIAVRVDQAVNGALRGNPQETISSRANRARVQRKRWGCMLCRLLDWFKRGHCEDAAGK